MQYFEIKSLKDLETLIDKLMVYMNKCETISEIKEKSRILHFLTYFSRYTISFATLINLYSEENKKDAILYVLKKLNLPNKEKLLEEFNQKYAIQNNLENIEEKIEVKEMETILENDTKITNIIKEVEDEVKYMSIKKLDENKLEEIKKFTIITDEERNFIRNETIENRKIIKIISGGKTFEVKENNDIIIIKIPSKSKLIIDKNIAFNYLEDDIKSTSNIFQKSNEDINTSEEVNEKVDDEIDLTKEEVLSETFKKKRGRKPKSKSEIDIDNNLPKKKRGRKPKSVIDTDNNETIKRILEG